MAIDTDLCQSWAIYNGSKSIVYARNLSLSLSSTLVRWKQTEFFWNAKEIERKNIRTSVWGSKS